MILPASPPSPAPRRQTLAPKRTPQTELGQSTPTHNARARSRGQGRSDAAQIEGSGKRKHADCTVLRVRGFSIRLLSVGTPGLHCRVGTTWGRAAPGHLLGSLQPLFLQGGVRVIADAVGDSLRAKRSSECLACLRPLLAKGGASRNTGRPAGFPAPTLKLQS